MEAASSDQSRRNTFRSSGSHRASSTFKSSPRLSPTLPSPSHSPLPLFSVNVSSLIFHCKNIYFPKSSDQIASSSMTTPVTPSSHPLMSPPLSQSNRHKNTEISSSRRSKFFSKTDSKNEREVVTSFSFYNGSDTNLEVTIPRALLRHLVRGKCVYERVCDEIERDREGKRLRDGLLVRLKRESNWQEGIRERWRDVDIFWIEMYCHGGPFRFRCNFAEKNRGF